MTLVWVLELGCLSDSASQYLISQSGHTRIWHQGDRHTMPRGKVTQRMSNMNISSSRESYSRHILNPAQ